MKYLSQQEIFDLANDLANGRTQEDMAERLGCSQVAVSNMLNGKPRLFSLAVRWIQLQGTAVETENGKAKRYYRIED